IKHPRKIIMSNPMHPRFASFFFAVKIYPPPAALEDTKVPEFFHTKPQGAQRDQQQVTHFRQNDSEAK
ncbi:MAG: hypothetical protein PF444_02645, partial [Bacteroidales bacterium]|nr:hypothetical protein [Bacteroidales bacterium]